VLACQNKKYFEKKQSDKFDKSIAKTNDIAKDVPQSIEDTDCIRVDSKCQHSTSVNSHSKERCIRMRPPTMDPCVVHSWSETHANWHTVRVRA